MNTECGSMMNVRDFFDMLYVMIYTDNDNGSKKYNLDTGFNCSFLDINEFNHIK